MAHHALAAGLPLGELLGVNRAGRVAIEAELERVPQVVEIEELRAALVRAVQKRAVRGRLRHFSSAQKTLCVGLHRSIGNGARNG